MQYIYCDRGTQMPVNIMGFGKRKSWAKKVQKGIYAVEQHSFNTFRRHQVHQHFNLSVKSRRCCRVHFQNVSPNVHIHKPYQTQLHTLHGAQEIQQLISSHFERNVDQFGSFSFTVNKSCTGEKQRGPKLSCNSTEATQLTRKKQKNRKKSQVTPQILQF